MLKTFKLNKLVRDKIKQVLIDEKFPFTIKKISTPEQMIQQFKEKLLEETNEVLVATQRSEMILELADCLEVIHGFAKALNHPFEEVEQTRLAKHQQKGGFDTQFVLDTVTLPATDTWATYFEQNPEKYPEVIPKTQESCETVS